MERYPRLAVDIKSALVFSNIDIAPAPIELCDQSMQLLQSAFWAAFKARSGWQASAFFVTLECFDSAGAKTKIEFPLLVLQRRLFRFFKLAYIPHGPAHCELIENKSDLLKALSVGLVQHLYSDCFVIRFDLPWLRSDSEPIWDFPALRKAFVDIQPPATVLLDITREESEILASMKSKCRYNIKLAERQGVEVRIVSEKDIDASLDAFYSLYQITARRDKISLHSRDYYKQLFVTAQRNVHVRLVLMFAYCDNELLAGIIVAQWKDTAFYLYGASSNAQRQRMPAYALQWAAIADAKKHGCKEYDFYGIPPNASPGHPMFGLLQFKTGFGGRIVHRPGTWDYPVRKSIYALYRAAENLRNYYHKTIKKTFGDKIKTMLCAFSLKK